MLWFLFRFDRFVEGAVAHQSRFFVVGWCFILSLSLSVQLMEWMGPGVVTSGPVYLSRTFLLCLALSMVAGVGGSVALGAVLSLLSDRKEGGLRIFDGFCIVVNAFLPLAVVLSTYLLVHHAFLAEAFWRGAVLTLTAPWAEWVFPLAWLWSGLRLAQAMPLVMPEGSALVLPARIAAIVVAMTAGGMLHPAVAALAGQDALVRWEKEKSSALGPAGALEEDFFHQMETGIPFHAVDARSELYLYRLQQQFLLGNMQGARADARRLERLSSRRSPREDVAQGLISFLDGRQDLAVQRWKRAVEKNPDTLAAHRWLALASVGSDPGRAEHHARILMQKDPHVFHLFLLVRILESQHKDAEIWEAMLEVNAPPEEWVPLTLLQGGLAAQSLGKTRRAEQLLALARERGQVVPETADSASE
jgi:tetratricopeptide (TPR) repeat protein